MNKILLWIDQRTGYKALLHDTLYERIPGGSRWRYVWGSTLVFTFSVQMITGLFLWMAYSANSNSAWESVYFIQHHMQFGWLLRGIHHFTAQAMVVLLALHLMQVIIDGAYKAPREVNFWLGLILMKITLGLSLTGYLLPWDQKGYWATQVATKISSITPLIGPQIQTLIQGGPSYGHHTLTRFFALHAGVLPMLLIGFLALHIYVFRRHGITVHDATRNPETTFWPDQVLKDAVACLGVLMVVLLLVFWGAPVSELGNIAEEGRLGEVLGADLGAPADPTDEYPARPEWYFLFLFQFLKYFPGETEIWGAMVIPGMVFGVMVMMPFIGKWKNGHRFNVAYIFLVMFGASFLTYEALKEDAHKKEYQQAVAAAEVKADRILELIESKNGIGYIPARAMLQSDPKTTGPALFINNCAQCHRYDGYDDTDQKMRTKATASDLTRFGTRAWIRGFITNPAGLKQFGATEHGAFNGKPIGKLFTEDGEMAGWAADNINLMTKQEIDGVVEFLVSQGGRENIPPPDEKLVEIGRKFFFEGNEEASACNDCHQMKDDQFEDNGTAGDYPNLTGYGSEAWLRDFLLHPGAEQHYAEDNRMPSSKDRILDKDLDILVKWLRRDWYEPAEK